VSSRNVVAPGGRDRRFLPSARRLAATPLLAIFALMATGDVSLLAQEGRVSGSVVEEATGEALAGAQIQAVGTPRGTQSDATGRFEISGLEGDSVRLRVLLPGYREVHRTVPVGATGIRIVLEETAVEIAGLVVTGTPRPTQRRELGNSVARLDAEDLNDVAPTSNVSDLITGKVAGVVVRTGSAMVGGGSQIRIRGISSLSLFQQQPLIYVDGVRVDNGIGDVGPQSQCPGQASAGGVVSRLDDFDPDEIESIEIIRGPAAATLYGTEASNGVIQIFTKKGAFNQRPRLALTIRQGSNWFRDAEDRWPTHFFEDPATGEIRTLNLIESERALGNDVFRSGHVQGYGAELTGGSDDLRYYMRLDYDDEEGFEPNNGREQITARMNLELAAHPTLDVGANLGFLDGETRLSGEVFRGIWPSLWGAQPTNEATRGWNGAPPEVWHENEEFVGELHRFTGGLNLAHRPLDWLSHRVNVGLDVVQEDNRNLIRGLAFNPLLDDFDIGRDQGQKFADRREVVTTSVDWAGTATLPLTPDVVSSTSVGFQLFDERTEFLSAEGRDFPAPGLDAIGATGITFGDDGFVENTTVGVYVQQQLGWKDRLFLTGAVRGDDNSAFGEDFDFIVYPKAGASWVASEEPFWDVPFVSTLKLRTAYGHSGQQPDAFAALRTFRPVPRADGTPAVTPQFLGNPELEPERGREIEVGFEAGLFDDRLGVDFTFYRQEIEDAILERATSPSLGFAGTRFENIGEIRNTGVELLVNALAVKSGSVNWELSVNLSRNDNEVVEVGEDADFIPSTFRGRHQEGFPAFSWFDQKIVQAELDADGNAINVLCDGGTGRGGVEPGGPAVPCDEAPEIFLGQAIPEYQGSVSTTLTLFDQFRVHGLVDFNAGFEQYNNTEQLTCVFALLCEENHFPERFDPLRIANIQEGCCFDFDIQEADFAKLRELSVTWLVPDELAAAFGAGTASVTVAGRDLAIWSDWSGLDPEGYQIGRPDRIGRQGLNAPAPSQILTTIRLNF